MTYKEALQLKPRVERLDFDNDEMTLTVPIDWLKPVVEALEKQVEVEDND